MIEVLSSSASALMSTITRFGSSMIGGRQAQGQGLGTVEDEGQGQMQGNNVNGYHITHPFNTPLKNITQTINPPSQPTLSTTHTLSTLSHFLFLSLLHCHPTTPCHPSTLLYHHHSLQQHTTATTASRTRSSTARLQSFECHGQPVSHQCQCAFSSHHRKVIYITPFQHTF